MESTGDTSRSPAATRARACSMLSSSLRSKISTGGNKRNIDIVQQERDGTTLRRWSLSRAWPVKFVAGDWDNESDENVIESVTLTFDFFELIQ